MRLVVVSGLSWNAQIRHGHRTAILERRRKKGGDRLVVGSGGDWRPWMMQRRRRFADGRVWQQRTQHLVGLDERLGGR